MTNYKNKYMELVDVVLNNAERIPSDIVTEAHIVHTRQDTPEETQEEKQDDKVNREEFEGMSYFEKVDFKENNPEAYDNAMKGEFK